MKLCGKLEMFPKYLKGLFCAQNRVFWIWGEFSLQCFAHPSFAVQEKLKTQQNSIEMHILKHARIIDFPQLGELVCKFELVRACHKHFYVTSIFTKWQLQWAKPITYHSFLGRQAVWIASTNLCNFPESSAPLPLPSSFFWWGEQAHFQREDSLKVLSVYFPRKLLQKHSWKWW